MSEAFLDAVAGLKVTLEEELATGAVRRERAAPLRQVLAALEDVLTKSGRGEMDDIQSISRVLGLMGSIAPLVGGNPGGARLRARARPPAGPGREVSYRTPTGAAN